MGGRHAPGAERGGGGGGGEGESDRVPMGVVSVPMASVQHPSDHTSARHPPPSCHTPAGGGPGGGVAGPAFIKVKGGEGRTEKG